MAVLSLGISIFLCRAVGLAVDYTWCSTNTPVLDLLYRASYDGFSGKSFRDGVSMKYRTITLVRVKSGDGRTESVVGGFSEVPWSWSREHEDTFCTGDRRSRGAFVFLLDSYKNAVVEPVKWGLKDASAKKAVRCYDTGGVGPCFGAEDLRVSFDSAESCTLRTGRKMYQVEEGSQFLALNGGTVEEIEVFDICSDVARCTPTAIPSERTPWQKRLAFREPSKRREMEEEFTRRFGASIASLLMEEQLALAYAQAKLKEAETRASTAVQALTVVYVSQRGGGHG